MHMTDISGFQGRTVPVSQGFNDIADQLLTETYWGFTVKNTQRASSIVQLSQAVSVVMGAGFAAAALGLWIVPSVAFQTDSALIRAGASVFFVIFSFFFISYANRGTVSELQIDLSLGEVREVLRHRSGSSSLLAHYGFDAFTGLSIDRSSGSPLQVKLILHHQDEAHDLVVATGNEPQIGKLFGRLERDLLRSEGSRPLAAVLPKPLT